MLMTAGLTRSATFENEPVVSGICTARMGASTGAAGARGARGGGRPGRPRPATSRSGGSGAGPPPRPLSISPPPHHATGVPAPGVSPPLQLVGTRHERRFLGRQDPTHAVVGAIE